MSRFRTLAPRLAVALAIGLIAGLLSAHFADVNAVANQPDIAYWWQGSRVWAHGVNPYTVLPRTIVWPFGDQLLYPLTALIAFLPFAWLALPLAAGLFIGLSSAWLAWLLTRDEGEGVRWWRLLLFLSPSFLFAVKMGQWSPLLTAAALVPAAGWLLAVKPTLGAALFVARPSWRAFLSGLVFLVLSLCLWPRWPQFWLANLHVLAAPHPIPILTPLGWPVALAALRWRDRDARFLLAMACVPQLLFFYDQLPLLLIPRRRVEAMLLSLAGTVAFLAWVQLALLHPDYALRAMSYVTAGCYLPALAIVLSRRANEGALPAWGERLAAHLPRRLRGRAPATVVS